MMRRRDLKVAVVALTCSAAIAVGADWYWVDGGADHDWDTCTNWITALDACYPCTSSDNALILDEPNDPNYPDGWIVNLIDIEELGDMTIQGSVQFGSAADGGPTIRPNILHINATGSEDDIIVTMDGGNIVVGSID